MIQKKKEEVKAEEAPKVEAVKEESSDENNTDSSVGVATPVNEEISDEIVTLEQNVVASEVTNETEADKKSQPKEDPTNMELGDKQ